MHIKWGLPFEEVFENPSLWLPLTGMTGQQLPQELGQTRLKDRMPAVFLDCLERASIVPQ